MERTGPVLLLSIFLISSHVYGQGIEISTIAGTNPEDGGTPIDCPTGGAFTLAISTLNTAVSSIQMPSAFAMVEAQGEDRD